MEGNLLLGRAVGARIKTCSVSEWTGVGADALIEAECNELRRGGAAPYAVPVGGSNALGCYGYVDAMHEVSRQMAAARLQPEPPLPACFDAVAHATGSGGTMVGAMLGIRAAPGLAGARLLAFAVCDDERYFLDRAAELCGALGVPGPQPGELEVHDAVGEGYALSTPEEVAFIAETARATGVLLDPTWVGPRGRRPRWAQSPRLCQLLGQGGYGTGAYAGSRARAVRGQVGAVHPHGRHFRTLRRIAGLPKRAAAALPLRRYLAEHPAARRTSSTNASLQQYRHRAHPIKTKAPAAASAASASPTIASAAIPATCETAWGG